MAQYNKVEISEEKYEALVRDSEQLRILKDFIRSEDVVIKSNIITLIEAMEAKINEQGNFERQPLPRK